MAKYFELSIVLLLMVVSVWCQSTEDTTEVGTTEEPAPEPPVAATIVPPVPPESVNVSVTSTHPPLVRTTGATKVTEVPSPQHDDKKVKKNAATGLVLSGSMVLVVMLGAKLVV